LIYSCDGILQKTEGLKELQKQGVIIADWEEAVKNHSDLSAEILQNPLVRWENGIFEAMNGAFLNMGILIYVPKNVQLPKPIQNWMYFTEPQRAYFPKITIIAEPGAELTYVENINAPLMHNPLFINGVTEIIVKENAGVNFARIQNLEDNAYYIDNGRAKVWDNGRFYHFQSNMGAGWAKTRFETKLVGQNADAKLDGICFASQNQHVHQTTMQIHEAPNSFSNLKYNTVVTDNAHTVYRGMIRAEENAQKIDAYQHNKNLILSDNAKADSIPGLEILTDDLSCSHGSTVGQIDQEQLYYLISRGIKEEDAKQLIVAGFLENIVQSLPDNNMKLLISDIIEGKILKELS
ncbi:MAG: Fe-S cluster assembly protein SufD, partial [Calditrichia bacterium]|nr:Fe-S cluster assembly protein SufD [Calditrichia bacterium]